jgi:hypothetical protein
MYPEEVQSSCREIAAYWERKKESSKTPFATPYASWRETVRCECGLCRAISTVLQDGGDSSAAAADIEDKDRKVAIKFSASGLRLEMDQKEREVFTLKRYVRALHSSRRTSM